MNPATVSTKDDDKPFRPVMNQPWKRDDCVDREGERRKRERKRNTKGMRPRESEGKRKKRREDVLGFFCQAGRAPVRDPPTPKCQ